MILVMCHGVFDLLHAGHVEHLRQAKEMGDFLMVSVVPDRFVEKPGRPIYSQSERLEILRAITYVDIAELCLGPGPQDLIGAFKPNIYVRGSDYKGKRMPEQDILDEIGTQIRYTKSLPTTTTEIINRIKMPCALHSW